MRWIENAIVQGPDIVDAIAKGAGDVRIRSSIIQQGLGLARLREMPVSDIEPDELRKTLDRQFGPRDKVRVVNARIELLDTTIRPGPEYDEDGNTLVALSATRAAFVHDVIVRGSNVEGSALFQRSMFLARAAFDGTRFAGRATFDGAAFLKNTLFSGARFEGITLFTYARFDGEAGFRRSRFEQTPVFDKARLCKPAHFGDARFASDVRFVDARLASDVYFLDVEVSRGANFSFAHIDGVLNLDRIHGGGVFTFAKSRIRALDIGSDDYRSRIDAELDFGDAWIAHAHLREVRFDAPLSFARGTMGPVGFKTEVYDRRADEPRMFRSAAFLGCERRDVKETVEHGSGDQDGSVMVLRNVDFNDRVTFSDTSFLGRAIFTGTHFRSGADMGRVVFKGRSDTLPFSDLPFAEVDVDWQSIGSYAALDARPADTPASELFEQLAARLLSQGRLFESLEARRASWWASVREARACLAARLSRSDTRISTPRCGEGVTSFIGSVFRAWVIPAWGVSSGFSTSLTQLMLVTALLLVVFAAVYHRGVHVLKRVHDEGEDGPGVRLHPLALPFTFVVRDDGGRPWRRRRGLMPALAFSTLVLLRFGTGDIAVRNAWRRDLSWFVAVEWALGIPLLIDLVYTLSETQPFLQRLLTGTIG